MTADTPTPYRPPDGVILTTLGDARWAGRGEVALPGLTPDDNISDWGNTRSLHTFTSDTLVWWRPTPERTVTIELPESVAEEASHDWCGDEAADAVRQACRDAIERLDGDD